MASKCSKLKWNHELHSMVDKGLFFTRDGVGVGVPITTPSLSFRLWSSEHQIVGVGSRSRRTKPITKRGSVHCDWLILPLLLPTPAIWFSLDHKRNVSDGVVSGVGRKWKRSDSYDSDSVALMTPLTTPIFDFHSVISALYDSAYHSDSECLMFD